MTEICVRSKKGKNYPIGPLTDYFSYPILGVTPKATSSSHFEKPKVVIRPAIAPKTEPKVQYVKVMGSKPIQQYVRTNFS